MKNLIFQFKGIDCKKFIKTGLQMRLNKKYKILKRQLLKVLINKLNKTSKLLIKNKQLNNNKYKTKK